MGDGEVFAENKVDRCPEQMMKVSPELKAVGGHRNRRKQVAVGLAVRVNRESDNATNYHMWHV